MLSKLFVEEVKRKDFSYREAAREIGISHTTAMRLRDNKNVDFAIIAKLATWLGEDFRTLVSLRSNNSLDLYSSMKVIFDQNPELEKEFSGCIELIEKYEIPPDVMDEIHAYARYKMSSSRTTEQD